MTHPATKADLNALHADAKVWGGGTGSLAQIMGDAGKVAESINMRWPKFAAHELMNTYEESQKHIADLLKQADHTFEGVSRSLTQAAEAYESNEATNRDVLRKSWQPK